MDSESKVFSSLIGTGLQSTRLTIDGYRGAYASPNNFTEAPIAVQGLVETMEGFAMLLGQFQDGLKNLDHISKEVRHICRVCLEVYQDKIFAVLGEISITPEETKTPGAWRMV